MGGGQQPGTASDSEPSQVSKEWHLAVKVDLRNHLVHKLVQSIYPSPNSAAMLDERVQNLVTYMRKVEEEMYQAANTRSEYYRLIAERIYKIKKQLHATRATAATLLQQLGPRKQLQQPDPVPQAALKQVHQKELQRLLAILRLPTSHGQKQEILSIFIANPPLVDAVIKQRQLQQHLVAPQKSRPEGHQKALQQPGPASRTSTADDQLREILDMLVSDPPLIAALIKQIQTGCVVAPRVPPRSTAHKTAPPPPHPPKPANSS